MKARRLIQAAFLTTAAVTGSASGKAPAAEASAAHRYTLRVGDKMTIPAVGQLCAVYKEGGAPELFCARPRHARHQVTIFLDSMEVWTVGNPDAAPVWSGRPSKQPVNFACHTVSNESSFAAASRSGISPAHSRRRTPLSRQEKGPGDAGPFR